MLEHPDQSCPGFKHVWRSGVLGSASGSPVPKWSGVGHRLALAWLIHLDDLGWHRIEVLTISAVSLTQSVPQHRSASRLSATPRITPWLARPVPRCGPSIWPYQTCAHRPGRGAMTMTVTIMLVISVIVTGVTWHGRGRLPEVDAQARKFRVADRPTQRYFTVLVSL
jgi:hypothetical protein